MTEIEKLALARSVYVEHAKADKGEIDSGWERDVITGNADSCHGIRIALRAIETLTAERDAALERVRRLKDRMEALLFRLDEFLTVGSDRRGNQIIWDNLRAEFDAAIKALEADDGRD